MRVRRQEPESGEGKTNKYISPVSGRVYDGRVRVIIGDSGLCVAIAERGVTNRGQWGVCVVIEDGDVCECVCMRLVSLTSGYI